MWSLRVCNRDSIGGRSEDCWDVDSTPVGWSECLFSVGGRYRENGECGPVGAFVGMYVSRGDREDESLALCKRCGFARGANGWC